MSHNLWFKTATPHPGCQASSALVVAGLNPESLDVWISEGEVLGTTVHDFDDAFHRLRDPGGGHVVALEQWSCRCGAVSWVLLSFLTVPSGHRFDGVVPAELSREFLDRADYLSRRIDLWVTANPEDTRAVRSRIARFLLEETR